LDIDILDRVNEGDPDGAVRSCQALLNLEHSYGNLMQSWVMMQRAETRAAMVRGVERALAQGEPGETVLAALQHRLDAIQREPLTLYVARGERAVTDRSIEWIQAHGTGDEAFHREWVLANLPQHLSWFLAGSWTEQRAALLEQNTQLVEIAKLPEQLQLAQIASMTPAVTNLPINFNFNWYRTRVAQCFVGSLAELRCAEAMLAVERYQRRHQRWPDSLETLVPDLISEVPKDPFDGQPLRYRRAKYGAVIYSVGSDGMDDGGNIIRIRSHYPNRPGTDLGVCLWDVAQRRRLAPEPFIAPPKSTSPNKLTPRSLVTDSED
jgi:hypothetical protein